MGANVVHLSFVAVRRPHNHKSTNYFVVTCFSDDKPKLLFYR